MMPLGEDLVDMQNGRTRKNSDRSGSAEMVDAYHHFYRILGCDDFYLFVLLYAACPQSYT
jgi:hypothetical protein